MKEYLSLRELGEIHGIKRESIRVNFAADRKKPRERRLYPEPDVVIGGGRLRGQVPGLELDPKEPLKYGDVEFGFSVQTAMTWQRPGKGARSDRLQPGEMAEYTQQQIDAAAAVLRANYDLIALLNTEPIADDKAWRDWSTRRRAAAERREKAREAYAGMFTGQTPPPTPQAVLHQYP